MEHNTELTTQGRRGVPTERGTQSFCKRQPPTPPHRVRRGRMRLEARTTLIPEPFFRAHIRVIVKSNGEAGSDKARACET